MGDMALEIQHDVALSALTTFQIGGSAAYFASVKSDEDLREALEWAKFHDVEAQILAGGSNVLVADAGFGGLIIHMQSISFSFAGTELSAEAGCSLLVLIRASAAKDLGGWETLSGIPGTIGGAIRGNAGAFGSEIKDFVHTVRALHRDSAHRAK